MSVLSLIVALSLVQMPPTAAPDTPAALSEPCRSWMSDIPLSEPGQSLRVDRTICFAGEITPESASALADAIREVPPDEHLVLVLRSLGGDVMAALDVADILQPRDVTGVVDSICASSCANYLLMSADRRMISRESILVWHGGWSPRHREVVRAELTRETRRRRPDETRVARLRRLVDEQYELGMARQAALLRSVGVDPEFFTWFDELNTTPRREWSPHCAAQREAGMIVLSDAFLAERGIVIDINEGPADAEALTRLLELRGAEGQACFWA